MAYSNAQRRETPAVGRRALAGGLAVELVWCLYAAGSRMQTPAARDLAYTWGYLLAAALSVALLAWVVLYFGFVRRSAPERGRRYLFLLLAFALVAQGGSLLVLQTAVAGERAEVRTAAQEIEAAAAALKDSPEAKLDLRPKATGDAGELERLMKTTFAEVQQDRLDYLAELRKAGVPERLNAETLAKDASLRTIRASLASAKAIVATYREHYRDRKAEARKAIARSGLSVLAKDMVLDAFDRAAVHADSGDALWGLEDATFAEMDAAAADLQHPKGRWTVHGEDVEFSQPADLQAYNQHLANLHALNERKAALRDQTFQQIKAEVDRLQGWAGLGRSDAP